ncbi:hypothetical protein ACFTRD_00335 [Paenibacillus sp. NPDC056933]|uniref:hypothetical protein n=1 Tax=Paenibacillus sp. NPDC056933 TaxID=3345968 RepID=UPI00363BE942
MNGSLKHRQSGTVGVYGGSVAVTTEILAESTEQFNRDANDMLEMNKSVDQSVQQIRQGAHTQKQGASDSANAMEEIAKGINDLSESSTAVSDAATSALAKASRA